MIAKSARCVFLVLNVPPTRGISTMSFRQASAKLANNLRSGKITPEKAIIISAGHFIKFGRPACLQKRSAPDEIVFYDEHGSKSPAGLLIPKKIMKSGSKKAMSWLSRHVTSFAKHVKSGWLNELIEIHDDLVSSGHTSGPEFRKVFSEKLIEMAKKYIKNEGNQRAVIVFINPAIEIEMLATGEDLIFLKRVISVMEKTKINFDKTGKMFELSGAQNGSIIYKDGNITILKKMKNEFSPEIIAELLLLQNVALLNHYPVGTHVNCYRTFLERAKTMITDKTFNTAGTNIVHLNWGGMDLSKISGMTVSDLEKGISVFTNDAVGMNYTPGNYGGNNFPSYVVTFLTMAGLSESAKFLVDKMTSSLLTLTMEKIRKETSDAATIKQVKTAWEHADYAKWYKAAFGCPPEFR